MDSDAEMMARHSAMLAELAAWSHELAGDLRDRALAAEEPAERAAYGRAFHDVARSVRQCVALEIRVRREVRRLARETDEAERPQRHALAERKRTVRAGLSRIVWQEYELEESAETEALIEQLMDEGFADPEAAEVPIDWLRGHLEERLCEALELMLDAAEEGAEESAHPGGGRDPDPAARDVRDPQTRSPETPSSSNWSPALAGESGPDRPLRPDSS